MYCKVKFPTDIKFKVGKRKFRCNLTKPLFEEVELEVWRTDTDAPVCLRKMYPCYCLLMQSPEVPRKVTQISQESKTFIGTQSEYALTSLACSPVDSI